MFRPLKALRAYRRLRRYREVFFTLLKYGFDDVVERIGPEILFWRRWSQPRGGPRDLPTPARLRHALADLGPTFVKFGQLLSTRSDILPREYIFELEKLQDEVPPFSFQEVRRILREELGKEPAELFQEFDPAPCASGSIAQVHRARLRDGTEVAAKIQRPGIRSVIETDLAILEEVAELVERQVPELRWFRPSELVRQFGRTIRRELDFVAEGHAADHFRLNFRDDPSYYVPEVFWEYSSPRILTTRFIQGVKITHFREIEARGLDRKSIARNGVRAILKEVFEHRFFHADPHPGNFFVLEGNVIAAVDFGIVGRLDEETSERLAMLLSALVHRDMEQLLRVFHSMELLGEEVDESLLKFDLLDFIDRYYGLPLEKIDAEQVVQDLLEILRRHRILLPMNLALMGRMLVVAAGVGRMLDPSLDLISEARPFMESFLLKRMDPRRRLRQLGNTLQGYREMLRTFPADLEEIVARLKKGKMLVSLHHEGMDRFILEMDRSSNRLAFGMIIASLIIGSSLVMQLDRGPMIFGFSVFGLGGYLIAALLGLWLVVAILRSGRI